MKQLERTITYKWWRGWKLDMKPEHISDLDEHANERIFEMLSEDFTSGDLQTTIDDVPYYGYWEVIKND